MKFIFVLMLALGATIAWQTSVLSNDKHSAAGNAAMEDMQHEGRRADPGSFDTTHGN